MKEKLNDEVLENVSGGTRAEIEELKDFIRTHDPDYSLNSDNDVDMWLLDRSKIKWDRINITDKGANYYVLQNRKQISHEEVMTMLAERFPD